MSVFYPEPTPGTSITLDLIHYRLVAPLNRKTVAAGAMRDVKRSLRLLPRREIGTLIPIGAARKTIPPRRVERSTHHPAPRRADRFPPPRARRSIYPPSCAAPIDFHHPARAGQYTHRPAPRQ